MKITILPAVLLTLMIFLSESLQAQMDFRKGYVITFSRDTLHGFIEYGNARNNPYGCYFKEDSLTDAKLYTPDELEQIIIGNYRHFISKEVILYQKPERIFLEYLVDGVMDIYFAIDNLDYEHYFAEKEGDLVEITSKEKITYVKDRPNLINTNKHIGVLKYMTRDTPELSQKIEKMDFEPRSLTNLAREYHELVCDSVACLVYMREDKALNDTRWINKAGIAGGFNFNDLSFNNSLIYTGQNFRDSITYEPIEAAHILNSNVGSQFGSNRFELKHVFFAPGIYLNMSPNWHTSFQLELWYNQLNYELDNNKLKIRSIYMPLILKREFFYYNRLSPYINMGISFDAVLSSSLENVYIEYAYLSQQENLIQEEYAEVQYQEYKFTGDLSMGLGAMIGVGITYDLGPRSGINLELRSDVHAFGSSDQLNGHIKQNSYFGSGSKSIIISAYYRFLGPEKIY